MKTPNAKARALLEKLQRLADPARGGLPDEIAAANRKIERLKARFDFSGPAPSETMDIFAGINVNRRFRRAAHVHTFQQTDFDIANSVKWAIEKATGVQCFFEGDSLLVEAAASTARKLAKVALHIAQSFQALLDRFARVSGVTASDRSLFVRGLYDGMMNDGREVGEVLPSRGYVPVGRKRARKQAVDKRPGLSIHPYTVALGLGKQIRFAAPLDAIRAELDRAVQAALGPG